MKKAVARATAFDSIRQRRAPRERARLRIGERLPRYIPIMSMGWAEKLPKLAATELVPTPIMLWPSSSSD